MDLKNNVKKYREFKTFDPATNEHKRHLVIVLSDKNSGSQAQENPDSVANLGSHREEFITEFGSFRQKQAKSQRSAEEKSHLESVGERLPSEIHQLSEQRLER